VLLCSAVRVSCVEGAWFAQHVQFAPFTRHHLSPPWVMSAPNTHPYTPTHPTHPTHTHTHIPPHPPPHPPTQGFRTKEEVQRFSELMDEMCYIVATKHSGSLKGEHGTGRNVAPYVEMEWGTKATELMWELKQLFDPEFVLNPGEGGGGFWGYVCACAAGGGGGGIC
jgi:FAD/FMN-containing dehydrogenase